MKKITSMFMAVAMILALTVPALASTSSAYITGSAVTSSALDGHKSEFKGEYQDTVLDIELPNNVVLVFNPYRLQYTSTVHASEDYAYLVDQLADQIFSAPVTIVSKSNIQLDVDMEFTVTKGAGSDIILAEEEADYNDAVDEENGEPGQNVLLQLQYGIVTAPNAEPSTAGSDMKTITLPETTGLTLADLQETDDSKEDDDASKQGNLTARIPASSGNGDEKYFSYKFTGKAQTTTEAAGDPKNPYDDQDTIDVGITFTFVPVANDPNQVQGGIFTYDAFANDGTTAIVAVANIGSVADDIDVKVPEGQEGTELASGKAWTLTNVKVDGAAIGANDIATTLAFGDDAKTLTLKKATVWEKSDKGGTGVAVGKKYVKVIHVEFTATSNESPAQVVDIDCNVRVIYNPQKAAS